MTMILRVHAGLQGFYHTHVAERLFIASEKQQASLCWPQSPTLCAAMKERIDDRPEVILVCVHGPSEYLPALPLNVAPGAARWRKQRTRDTMCTLRRIVNGESQLLVSNAVKRLEFGKASAAKALMCTNECSVNSSLKKRVASLRH